MAAGSKSVVYQALLCGWGKISKLMGRSFKYLLPNSSVKVIFESVINCLVVLLQC